MPAEATGTQTTNTQAAAVGTTATQGVTGGQQQTGAGAQSQTAAPSTVKFDEWIATQDATIKAAYAEHTQGLLNAVKATREERDALAKQIKDLLPKAEKGSELEKSLSELNTRLETAEKRATFLEAATQPGIDCRNPRAAYALAVAENLFTRQGLPDWDGLKKVAPELFGRVTPPANAGSGTQAGPPATSMNDLIRRAAGRG